MCGRPVGTYLRRIRRRGRQSAGPGQRRARTHPRPPWPTSRSERCGPEGVVDRGAQLWRAAPPGRSRGETTHGHQTIVTSRPPSPSVALVPRHPGASALAWHDAAHQPRLGAPWRLRRQERGTRWPEHAGRSRPVSSLPLVTSRADVGLSVCGRPHGVLLPRCPHPRKDHPDDTP
jgi:hypothetical protein